MASSFPRGRPLVRICTWLVIYGQETGGEVAFFFVLGLLHPGKVAFLSSACSTSILESNNSKLL